MTRLIGLLGLLATIATAQEAEIEALKSPNARTRREAAKALGAMGKKAAAAVPALIASLDDPNALVRGAALLALGPIGDARAAGPVATRLLSPDPRTRRLAIKAITALGPPAAKAVHAAWNEAPNAAVARALAGLGEAARPALPDLTKQMALTDHTGLPRRSPEGRGRDGDVSVFAAFAILALEPNHEKARTILKKALTSGTVEEATLALDHKERFPAVTLALALQHEAAPVRWRACRALGALGPKAAPAMAALIRELVSQTHVRRAAAGALGRIGEPALPALVEALRAADCAREVGHACQTMREPASRRLLPLLGDDDAAVAARAAAVLADLRADAALPALRKALSHADPRVRLEAGRAVWLITGEAKDAVPAIAAGLDSPDPVVRRHAAATLFTLGAAAKPAEAVLVRATRDTDPKVAAIASKILKKLQR